MKLDHIRRDPSTEGRDVGILEGPRRDDDVGCLQTAGAGLDLEAVIRPLLLNGRRFYAETKRWIKLGDVIIDVLNHLVTRQKAVRLIPSVGKAGQLHLPIRGHQCKGIPFFAAPRLGNPILFEHGVFATLLGQIIADRKACLPATDH